MDRFNIKKINKIAIVVAIILILTSLLLTFTKGFEYDTVFSNGIKIQFAFNKNDFDLFYNQSVKTFEKNSNIEISYFTFLSDCIFTATVPLLPSDKSGVNEISSLTKLFKSNDYKIVFEKHFYENYGRQVAFRYIFIYLIFIVFIIISSIILYNEIGGLTTAFTFVFTISLNMIILLAMFSFFRIKIGSNLFILMILSIIYICIILVYIFSRAKEFVGKSPLNTFTAESLINQSLSSTLTSLTMIFFSTLLGVFLISAIMVVIFKFSGILNIVLVITTLLINYFISILFAPSFWYILSKNKKF